MFLEKLQTVAFISFILRGRSKGTVMETTLQPGSVDAAMISRLVAQLDSIGEATPRLVGPDGYGVDLPVELYSILRKVADELKAGNGVTVIPVSAVMTTAQAAETLNVSRPHVVKLIDNGEIPHHMSGTHRRDRSPTHGSRAR